MAVQPQLSPKVRDCFGRIFSAGIYFDLQTCKFLYIILSFAVIIGEMRVPGSLSEN